MILTDWKIAMVFALVFVALPRAERPTRLWVWAVMMISSFAALIHYSLWLFVIIDIIGAILILLPPRGVWQKAIGFCYIAMLLITTGFALSRLQVFSSAAPDPHLLQFAHATIGWIALALLVLWTVDDAARPHLDRNRNRRGLAPADVGRV